MDTLPANARILAVRLGNIRDVIMVGPAVGALRRAYPAAEIAVWTSPPGAAAARLLPGVSGVLMGPAPKGPTAGAGGTNDHPAFLAALKACRFGAAFIFTNPAETPYGSAFAAYLSGIPIRVGQSAEFGGDLLTDWIKPFADDGHQIDRNIHLLEKVGISITRRNLRLTVPEQAQWRVSRLLHETGVRRPFVVMAPGGTSAARRYPVWRYAAVARYLRERGLAVVCVGSARDSAAAGCITAAAPGAVSLCGRANLAEVAALIRRAQLFVGHDSGLMHVADALSCPMVILYAGTEPLAQWRPCTSRVMILRRPTACTPCYRLDCPYEQQCLEVDPQQVAGAAMNLLRRPAGSVYRV